MPEDGRPKKQAGHTDMVQYKTLNWIEVGALILTETVSLGILSLPQAIATLGLGAGTSTVVVFGIIAWYTGCEIGRFKRAFPAVGDMSDAGLLMFGPWGSHFLAFAQLTVLVFIMSAHLASFSVMMNVLTDHAGCSIGFGAAGLALSVLLSLPRRLKSQTIASIVSCVSVAAASLIALVSVVASRRHPSPEVVVVGRAGFQESMVAVLNIVMAFSGHVAFLGFAAELAKPADFSKAVSMVMIVATSFYVLVGVIVYVYVGPNVPSPALGAASAVVRKVAYGVAMPTIVVAGVINGHVAAKQVYLRVWRGTVVHRQRSFRAIASWVGIVVAVWCVAFVIAQSVPDLHHLLALVSALFCGWFSFGLSGFLHLYRQARLIGGRRGLGPAAVNVGVVIMGLLLCVLGLYATGASIASGGGGRPWSCADNSRAELEVPGE